MSLPRQVLPGADYMITRRCSGRRFFLRPDEETNNAFSFCLGLAAQRAKVDLLFAQAMSNPYHAGVHETFGNLPIFSEHFIRSWMDGLTSLVLSYGTYWMIKFARVACEAAEAVQEAMALPRGAPVAA